MEAYLTFERSGTGPAGSRAGRVPSLSIRAFPTRPRQWQVTADVSKTNIPIPMPELNSSPKSSSAPRKWWIIGGILVLSVILMYTNPDQAVHLKAVNEAIQLRYSGRAPDSPDMARFMFLIKFHNYGLFSYATVFDKPISYGLLGRVQTTGDVMDVVTGPPSAK